MSDKPILWSRLSSGGWSMPFEPTPVLQGGEHVSMQKWQDQIAVGRVFEIRSKSARYPAPCVLVVNDSPEVWTNPPMVVGVDRYGVVGHGIYRRPSNPHIYVDNMRRRDFTSRKIARRRPDLEQFDAEDIALIKYGIPLAFGGRLTPTYVHGVGMLPLVVPAAWTIFWTLDDGYWRMPGEERGNLQALLSGTWHFEQYGGPASCGFKFRHAWFTRHTAPGRLRQIEGLLRKRVGHLVRQDARIVRWHDPSTGWVHTQEARRDCPALMSRRSSVETAGAVWRSMGND